MRFPYEISCFWVNNFRMRFPYESSCFLQHNLLMKFLAFWAATRFPYEISYFLGLMRCSNEFLCFLNPMRYPYEIPHDEICLREFMLFSWTVILCDFMLFGCYEISL